MSTTMDSISRQGTTISRYRSQRLKNRLIADEGDTPGISPAIDVPRVAGLAASDPMRAVDSVRSAAVRSSDDHTETILVPSDTLQSAHSVVGTQEHPQPTTPRHRDGPPRSSEINATTVPKARRVPSNDNERHVGCFGFFRRGTRSRAEQGSVTKAKTGGLAEDSTVDYHCYACSKGAHEPERVNPGRGADSEVFRQADAQGYQHKRELGSGSLPEPAKQESVNHFAVDTVSRDWRLLEHTDPATQSSSNLSHNLSPGSPHDMRHGAVQPQYFYTEEASTQRQIPATKLPHRTSTQRSTVGTTTGSTPSTVRSSTTLSTNPSISRKPLVDLTPQYQPPPQHRHKGHGYYPEQIGSGKLVDYATSPKKEPTFHFA